MTDILGGDHTATTATSTPTTTEALQTLVGEGKKFKDAEALARAKLESDAFIAKIQDENAKLREEVLKRTALEDQLARLTQDGTAAPVTTPAASGTTPTSPTSSPADVEALLEKKLSERETKLQQQANVDLVNKALLDKFGGDANKAKEAVAVLNDSLGINLRDLAATSPAAVLRLIGVESRSSGGVPSERTTINLHGQTGEIRNHAYYEKLRTTMGNAKFLSDRRLQLELHKDAQRMGDDFYK